MLSILVCLHPKIIGFGDTYNYQFVELTDTQCKCGASPSNNCPIRVEIKNQMNKLGHQFKWTRSNPTPLFDVMRSNKRAVRISRKVYWFYVYKKLPTSFRKFIFYNYYKENIAFMQTLKKVGNYECYFDGCKNITRLELLRTVFPDTRVVHLIKNPNAFLHSVLKRGNKNYKKIVDAWFRYNNNARQYKEKLGQQKYLLICYEDLARNPAHVLQKVFNTIGMPVYEPSINPRLHLGRVHVIGNKMKNSFEKVEDRSPNWREELEQHQIVYIERKKAELNWIKSIYP
jgi:hypothetical protein